MKKGKEIRTIYVLVLVLFLRFLAVPICGILYQSFSGSTGLGLQNYAEIFKGRGFASAFANSIKIAAVSALTSTVLAFFLAYTIHYTNVPKRIKKVISVLAVLPMLLPTITYGFAIIYSFGRQGLITKLLGYQLFDMYGFKGLWIGYVIYTLPISFLLVSNAMGYIDKKFTLVSRVMQDPPVRTFLKTVLGPLAGTLAASMVQCFFLTFTDYGIPASVGGEYKVIATVLYNEMLGSIPDFQRGAVVAVVMLLPSVLSIMLLRYLEKWNVRYQKISVIEIKKNPVRDCVCMGMSAVILTAVLSVFLVIFLVPFVEEWPYRIQFSTKHLLEVWKDPALTAVYKNSLFTAFMTASCGLILSYAAALAAGRSDLKKRSKAVIEGIALVGNTIPGMVIGIAYMETFSGTSLQNTFALMIVCNMVHFFSTPYLMIKGALEKLNDSWETTALLMGDHWFKTLFRIVTPNMKATLLEVFSYYFVNSMVTVSAVIFIAGARTMVITTKIKELQYYTKFNEVFVLSILILVSNLAVKGLVGFLNSKKAAEAASKLKGKKKILEKRKEAAI